MNIYMHVHMIADVYTCIETQVMSCLDLQKNVLQKLFKQISWCHGRPRFAQVPDGVSSFLATNRPYRVRFCGSGAG